MADQDSGLEKPKKGTEQSPDVLEKQSTRERAGLSLELAEKRGIGSQNIDVQIKSIDPSRDLSEQKEIMSALDTVLEQLISKALDGKVKLEEIQKNPLVLARFAQNGTEKVAVAKLGNLITHSKEFQSKWSKFCTESEKTYQRSDGAKTSLEKGKTPEGHEWMGTALRMGLIAAGAYGAYKLYQWIKHRNDNDADESEKSFPYVSAALTTLGVGALIGPERLASWSSKYMGLELSSEALKRFWDNLKKWKLKEAFSSFLFETNNPGINKTAEKLGIDRSHLIDLKDVNYKEFKKFRSNPKSKTMGYAGQAAEFLGIDLSSNIIGTNLDDQIRAAEDEEKLFSFIEKNQIKGKNLDAMSISEILNEYEKNGILEGIPEKKVEVERGTLETMGSKFPHARGAYEAWKNDEIDTDEALGQVIKGTVDDGGALIIKDGGLYLLKKAGQLVTIAFISNSQIICDTVKNIAGMLTGKKGLSDALIDYYEDGGLWFVGGGALYGWMTKGGLRGAGKGAWGGFKTSYLFVPRTLKWAKQGAGVAKRASFSLNEWTAATEEEKIAMLRAKAIYHAEEFAKYSQKLNKEQSPGMTKGLKEKLLKRLYPDWTRDEVTGHAQFFKEAREQFLAKMKISGAKTFTDDEIITSARSRSELLDLAKTFENDHPESSLPKIPRVKTAQTQQKTLAEANTARLPKLKLTVNQIDRLTKLGFDEQAAIRMRELKLSPREVDDLLTKMETDPKLIKAFELVVAQNRYPQLFNALRSVKKVAVPAMILFTIAEFDASSDKTSFIMKDAGLLAVFAAAFKTSEMTVGTKIPNPIVGLIVSGLIASGAAFGGDKLWEEYADPLLEKNFANRDNFWKNTATGATLADAIDLINPIGGSKYGKAQKTLSRLGFTGAVDEETDPLEYLAEDVRMIDPYGNLLSGDRFSIYRTEKLRNYEQFMDNSKSTLAKYKGELAEAENTNPARAAELRTAIPKLESYLDGSWLNEKKTTLILIKSLQLEPAYEEFKGMAIAKFGDDSHLTYTKMMSAIERGEREIISGQMNDMWEYLYDQSINLHGKAIKFRDYVALTASVGMESRKIAAVTSLINKEGMTPDEGKMQA